MGHAQLRTPEDVDDVEWPGRRGRFAQRPEGRDPEYVPAVRVDGNALVAAVDEGSEDPEGRSALVRRGADDRDSPAGPEELRDPAVVEERYRTAALLSVEEIADPVSLLGRQVVPSLVYG
jgi:hypothetical protein